jgi:hypothetical protein
MFPPVHDVIDIAGANHIPRLLVDDRQQGSQKRIRAAYKKKRGDDTLPSVGFSSVIPELLTALSEFAGLHFVHSSAVCCCVRAAEAVTVVLR